MTDDRRGLGPGRRADDYDAGVLAGQISARLENVETAAAKTYETAGKVAVIEEQFKGLREEQAATRQEIRGLRRSLWAWTLSVAGGAVLFALGASDLAS